MKNFYEATVTRPALKVEVFLTLTPIGDVPCRLYINGEQHLNITITEPMSLSCSVPLIEPIDIQVQIQRSHPKALQIALAIDSFEVLPLYQHLALPQTCYIDSNEIWQFKINSFYPWLHETTGQGWIS
jgi:hypothetical protein